MWSIVRVKGKDEEPCDMNNRSLAVGPSSALKIDDVGAVVKVMNRMNVRVGIDKIA